MFVALRVLKEVDRAGTVRIYNPGDRIPTFENWDIHARRAHLNMEWVTELPGDESQHSPPAIPSEEFEVHCEPCGKTFKHAKALKTHNTLVHK